MFVIFNYFFTFNTLINKPDVFDIQVTVHRDVFL